MKKSISLAALAVAIFFAPVTFANGGNKQQTPKEKSAKVEKKEAKSDQKTAESAKKHHKKEKKD